MRRLCWEMSESGDESSFIVQNLSSLLVDMDQQFRISRFHDVRNERIML